MKDTVLSNCEAKFVNEAIEKKLRLDGRKFDEYRKIDLSFGSEYGCVYVSLGETRCVVQVSCELVEPRFTRPNEGTLFINLEINDLVYSNFETGQQTHLQAHANRLLENCFKESHCVDLESLCIISGEQAWEIRVDVTVLNYDGNIHTCCSVAVLAALSHFRTPQVSNEGGQIVVRPIHEYAPTPLSLHHFPILLSYAVFKNDHVLDPTELEEKVSDAELVLGLNSFQELCGIHFRGDNLNAKDTILNSAHSGARIASEIISMIKEKLSEESELRIKGKGKTPGLTEVIDISRILSACTDRSLQLSETGFEQKIQEVQIETSDEEVVQDDKNEESEEDSKYKKVSTIDKRKGVRVEAVEFSKKKEWVPTGEDNAWETPNAEIDESEESSESDDDVDFVKTITDEDRIIDKIELSGDSEEDDVVILSSKDVS